MWSRYDITVSMLSPLDEIVQKTNSLLTGCIKKTSRIWKIVLGNVTGKMAYIFSSAALLSLSIRIFKNRGLHFIGHIC